MFDGSQRSCWPTSGATLISGADAMKTAKEPLNKSSRRKPGSRKCMNFLDSGFRRNDGPRLVHRLPKTVTLGVSSRAAESRRTLSAFEGKKQGAFISFATPELLWSVLTSKRWDILRAMAGAGPLTIRETARRVERDVKAVHGDVHALLVAGILRRGASGKVEFPFEAVRVNFTLKAA
jgi:predicted transcriptional regulator